MVKSFLRKHAAVMLALAILTGFMQVQTVYACAMMDQVFHGQCCCEDEHPCADLGCDDTLSSATENCCEVSVDINVSRDELNTSVSRDQVRSDVDPPGAKATLDTQPSAFLALSAAGHHWPVTGAFQLAAQQTYLLTQRLRI